MRLFPIAIGTVAAVAVIGISSSAYAAPQTKVIVKENDSQNSVQEYWTPERLRSAKPFTPEVARELKSFPNEAVHADGDGGDGAEPEAGIEPKFEQLYPVSPELKSLSVPKNRGTLNQQFSSSRLVPISADTTYPYRAVGKLFFTIPNQGNFVCSASVLRPRVLVTAGHCVHRGSGGSGGFYTNWLFVPAFRDGAAPFQTWSWKYVATTNTWATGNGNVPNAADYGMLELEDRTFNDSLKKIGTVTGYLGYQTLSLNPNHTHMLGYPCNLDSCQKMHQVAAQSARNVSPNCVEYGSDARGGSSGGPWVQNFGALASGQTGGLNAGLNRVVGITSYGYVSTDPKAQGSSVPDSRFTDLLNNVCAHKAGNCA